MKSTYSIIFYLKREKLKKDGTYPVMGRITVDGTQCQFSCKVDCKPDLWENKGGSAIGKSVMARNVNMELDRKPRCTSTRPSISMSGSSCANTIECRIWR